VRPGWGCSAQLAVPSAAAGGGLAGIKVGVGAGDDDRAVAGEVEGVAARGGGEDGEQAWVAGRTFRGASLRRSSVTARLWVGATV
jgi:hypothetical protein